MSLAHVLELAEQLNPEDKRALAVRLQLDHLGAFAHEVTRESLEEPRLALKAAGTFEHAQSLAGRYGPPRLDISEEELHTTISPRCMIAGLATRLRIPLLTHDQKIVASDTVRVGW